ncbi:hypothetical protein [Zhongshania sp.]|uniref:hypothetical protein n=1 Tax=Zhongshania sp. TaxID=1971902 RepID=UPI002A807337|nr:hypothetical protein [Zhongshania sp.]
MSFSPIEQEVVGLCVSYEAAVDIANHALLELQVCSRHPEEKRALFPSHIHEQLFLIRLLDFVSEKGNSQLTGVKGSCLDVLEAACNSACFEESGRVEVLRSAVVELRVWLAYSGKTKLWLPSLDINAELEVSRLDFLFIAANHSKHNLSRLTGVANRISSFLNDHGYEISTEEIPLALDDFREHLSENYFVYYGTWLTELVNNIAWGVWTYLQPQFERSFRPEGRNSLFYSYDYPKGVSDPIAQRWFDRLMGNIHTRPYLEQFLGDQDLKEKCSLEWFE